MPDLSAFLSGLAFDRPVAYPAIGGVVLGLIVAFVAWRYRARAVSVWLWTLSALALAAGLTLLIASVAAAPRDLSLYAAASAGLIAAVIALLVADLLFSESRRPTFVVSQAVGLRAQVYQAIPEAGSGRGRVRVHAGGRSVLLSAATAGPQIPRYAFVRVCSGKPDGRVQVEWDDRNP